MPNQIDLPHWRVERASKPVVELDDAEVWTPLRAITPLWLADGSSPAPQATTVRICYDAAALYVRFDCRDRDIWGTYTERDQPIYDEEVVEVFIVAGAAEPTRYKEFQVSPNGVLFDAAIYNPTSTRADLKWDATWNCADIRWMAQRNDVAGEWWGAFAIPWACISPDATKPSICRANFYRIERPHDGAVEYSCWSPTMTDPADFHKPAYFGILEFD